ncbi:MAG: right-handed parallel beta-helix repeat-containing protein [Thermoanaerobaculia bacterium]
MSKRLLHVCALAGFALLLTVSFSRTAEASEFYVSPEGTSWADGSYDQPWDLQTALNQPYPVAAGDTIWMRGGTYRRWSVSAYSFMSWLNGAPGAPITLRQSPGERATIDSAGSIYGGLLIYGSSWTVYRDFEVTNSDWSGWAKPAGLWVRNSNNVKFVNLVVHDVPGQGVGFWNESTDSEISGCLIYYNGKTKLEHGIYLDNATGEKRVADNILFDNYGYGIHGYSSSRGSHQDNITVDGNISFTNGFLEPGNAGTGNILVGVDTESEPARNLRITNNATWHSSDVSAETGGQEFGYSNGCVDPRVTNNFFVGLTRWENCSSGNISGNIFYGRQWTWGWTGPRVNASSYPDNSFNTGRPDSGADVRVRANEYESGRANVAVYNWGRADSVDVDLSSVLAYGAAYEVRNAQNFYGAPVASGVYGGGTVSLPTWGSPAAPVAFSTPRQTGPEFSAFVVVTRN